MAQIVFIRHGESIWNSEERFTGWDDIPLSEEARPVLSDVGLTLLEELYKFDVAITSYLDRSIVSCWEVLDSMNLLWIPEIRDWRLNPRHYGVLQGMTKEDAAAQYGQEMIENIRHSFDIQPPLLNENDERNPRNDIRYQKIERSLPIGESMEDAEVRVLQFFDEVLAPLLKEDKRVLISGHEDSLKLLIKRMEGLSTEEMLELKLPPAKPIALELEGDKVVRKFIE